MTFACWLIIFPITLDSNEAYVVWEIKQIVSNCGRIITFYNFEHEIELISFILDNFYFNEQTIGYESAIIGTP